MTSHPLARPHARPRAVPRPRLPPLGVAWLATASALAAIAVLGPLVSGVVDWRITDLVHDQLLGLDAVSLAVVAPLAALAGVLVLRGHPLGPLLGIGPAAYAAYMAPQYVLGPDYLDLTGNNEQAFPLVLALFVLGIVTAIAAWGAIDLDRLRTSARAERLAGRVLLPLAGVAVFARYLGSLPDMMGSAPAMEEYRAGPTFVWTITLLDLGLLLPAVAATCIGVRCGVRWARRALYAVVAWLALIGTAVAGMAVAMRLQGQPSMSVGAMVVMLALAVMLLGIAVLLYAPVVRRPRW
jgi:hypothetical protein